MKNNSFVRLMKESDIDDFYNAFADQGWHNPKEQFIYYFDLHSQCKHTVLVAESNKKAVGYIIVKHSPEYGPYASTNYAELKDFNVFIPYQRQGFGTMLMGAAEREAAKISDTVCLGVGLHSGYGAAQRMYTKRGYVFDGSGVWYQDKLLGQYAPCINDDDLVLYMSKKLR